MCALRSQEHSSFECVNFPLSVGSGAVMWTGKLSSGRMHILEFLGSRGTAGFPFRSVPHGTAFSSRVPRPRCRLRLWFDPRCAARLASLSRPP